MKKTLTIILAFVLVIALSVAGTVAYLTDSDNVSNTFTVGKVDIELDEAKVDETGKKIEGEGAERVKANKYHILPGEKYDKDPTVTVKAGSEECYVRVQVTVNNKADLISIFGSDFDLAGIFLGHDESKWTRNSISGFGDTMTYEYRYKGTVAKSESDTVLEPLFEKIAIPPTLTNEQLASINDLSIRVYAQAIQASGFENADAAWKTVEGF